MTPNELSAELHKILFEVAPPRFDKKTREDHPITPEQWATLRDRFNAICEFNWPTINRAPTTNRRMVRKVASRLLEQYLEDRRNGKQVTSSGRTESDHPDSPSAA